ncbi:ubiquitin carboxyl-terminal hydrolase 36-like [Carassius auratus]|uniref:Ubiquitin carboxyl-terminal hydrolase 36-like n=1 Tax=Carassius auratus TaxID=7957 RepID=A0A6P6PU51_CARAU|nr:ubiquitin carboxyl-terminal hydrolase 36-like [Carassius auratus]
MADKRHMCLLGRIILCALLTGISGSEVTRVFFSSGEDVRLSCNNALSGCTSTTWNYNRPSGSETAVELIALGIKKNNTERHERLSLGSDCSLNIKEVTKEDRGEYTCRQYVNGQQHGADAQVYLHVLHVSSSSSQSEIRSGHSLTLSCQLYNDDRVSCDTLVRSEGLDLIWVNQAGVNLQTDSRFQISFSSEQCNISLTTTLLNEDHNREWRCQLKHRDQLKTSATYTVKYPTPSETNPPSPVTSSKSASAPTQAASADSTLIPVSSSNSEKKSSQTTAASTEQEKQTPQTPETTATQRASADSTLIPVSSSNSEKKSSQTTAASTEQETQTPQTPETTATQRVIRIVASSALAVLVTAVILWLVRKKRADNRKGTNDSVEQKDDATYTEIDTNWKIEAKNNKVHDDDDDEDDDDDDEGIYSFITQATVEPQDDCS